MSAQENRAAWGQGYFFLATGVLLVADEEVLDFVIGVVGSFLMVAEEAAEESGGNVAVFAAEEGVWKVCGESCGSEASARAALCS